MTTIKIFPEIGDVYFISFTSDKSESEIQIWIEDNLNFVDHWEVVE